MAILLKNSTANIYQNCSKATDNATSRRTEMSSHVLQSDHLKASTEPRCLKQFENIHCDFSFSDQDEAFHVPLCTVTIVVHVDGETVLL